MEVFLLIVTVFGLLYLFIAGVRWAFKIDKAEWRKRERLSRKERNRLNVIYDDIVEKLREEREK